MEICGSIFVPTLSEAKDFFLSQSVTVGPEELCYSLNINNVVDRSRGILFASKMAPERDLPFLIVISKDLHQRERGKRPPLFNGGGGESRETGSVLEWTSKEIVISEKWKGSFLCKSRRGFAFRTGLSRGPFWVRFLPKTLTGCSQGASNPTR